MPVDDLFEGDMKLSKNQLLALQRGSLGPFGNFEEVRKAKVFMNKILHQTYYQGVEKEILDNAITNANQYWPNNFRRIKGKNRTNNVTSGFIFFGFVWKAILKIFNPENWVTSYWEYLIQWYWYWLMVTFMRRTFSVKKEALREFRKKHILGAEWCPLKSRILFSLVHSEGKKNS